MAKYGCSVFVEGRLASNYSIWLDAVRHQPEGNDNVYPLWLVAMHIHPDLRHLAEWSVVSYHQHLS